MTKERGFLMKKTFFCFLFTISLVLSFSFVYADHFTLAPKTYYRIAHPVQMAFGSSESICRASNVNCNQSMKTITMNHDFKINRTESSIFHMKRSTLSYRSDDIHRLTSTVTMADTRTEFSTKSIMFCPNR